MSLLPNGLAWTRTLKDYGAGVRLVENPTVAISAVSPTQILINNPNRVFWLLQNLSPYYGVIAFNNAVTLSSGVMVAGVGGLVTMIVSEDGESVTYPLWGIESVAGQTWYLMELVQA